MFLLAAVAAVRRSLMMKVDSLEGLRLAFKEWRGSKKHAREAIPEELRARARRAMERHGLRAVVGVTRVEAGRLLRSRRAARKAGDERARGEQPRLVTPTFSRLEVSAPTTPRLRPMAEVETGSGVTLRLFEQTPELMELLSVVCGLGGAR
jgi:hypothetical protein